MSESDRIKFDVVAAGEPSDDAIAALARLLLNASDRTSESTPDVRTAKHRLDDYGGSQASRFSSKDPDGAVGGCAH